MLDLVALVDMLVTPHPPPHAIIVSTIGGCWKDHEIWR